MSAIDSKIENLNRKIELLSDKIDSQNIVGGDGILVRKSGNEFTISNNDEESVDGVHPWALRATRYNDNTLYWSTYGGTINGLLPDGFTRIGDIKISDNAVRYVYYEAKINFLGLEDIKIRMSKDLPDTNRYLVKNASPLEIRGLIGMIQGSVLLYQIISTNLEIRVEKAFSVENLDGAVDNYYKFVVNE